MTLKQPDNEILHSVTFKLLDAQYFRNLLKAIEVINSEATFEVSQEGINVRIMDESHVCLVDATIPNAVCEVYEYNSEVSSFDFVVDLEDILNTVFKRTKKQDKVLVEVILKSTEGSITFTFQSEGSYAKVISQPLNTLEIPEKPPKPRINFDVFHRLVAKEVVDILKDATVFKNEVLLMSSEDTLVVDASSDKGTFTVNITKSEPYVLTHQVQRNSRSRFAIDYIQPIVEAIAKISELITLEYSSNMPIRLGAELPMGFSVVYYIAPKIDSEDV